MKNISKNIYTVLLIIFITACDDNLDKIPVDSLVEETTFTSNESFATFAWGFYPRLGGYGTAIPETDIIADLMVRNTGTQDNNWLWQLITVPNTSNTYSGAYTTIRRTNFMIKNAEIPALSQSESNHWKAIARFFRANEYFRLLKLYGGVPLVGDDVLTDQSPELFEARASRDEVASYILNELLFAEQNIVADANDNTIDADVVRALISRFGLFEGTWRKYHNLGDEDKYLQASYNASSQLLNDNTSLMSSYDLVFNSESLSNAAGILLYRPYIIGEATHILTSRHRNSAGRWDLTKKGVDKYLCTDGLNRWQSPLFDGEQDPYDEFRNRDRRLYYTVVPPFKVTTIGSNVNRATAWEYDPDPRHREYLDIMMQLSDAEHKGAPTSNWVGFIVKQEPHFRRFNRGQGFNVSYTGYRLHKYYNNLNTGIQNQDFADMPLFRMGEVMVNHAEVAYELSMFTQDVADATINRLRARGGVANLDVGNIAPDPTRDADISPELWEIRRERAVELMAEGYRFEDIKRWRKFVEYGSQEKLGMYIVGSDFNNRLPIQNGTPAGYISPFGVPPGVPEHYYLSPLPSNEIILNPNLVQNPGWEQ
jgi:hypothetical protein